MSARAMHMPLPSTMKVTLRAVDNNDVTLLAAAGYDGYQYPLYFPGLWKDNVGTPAFAGGFLQLMQLYSKAYVRRVRIKTRCMAINNGTNANLNIYTFVCSENQANTLGALTTLAEFQDSSNTYLAKKHYLSTFTGGYAYCQETRSVDFGKYTGIGDTNANLIYRSGSGQITTPSAGEALTYPNYVIVVKYPNGTASQNVSFEHVMDVDIEFRELGSLPQQITSLVSTSFARRV